LKDNRIQPQILTGAIWLSAVFMFATRKGSINGIEMELRVPKRLEKIIGKRKPKADIIGDVFALTETDPIRLILSQLNYKIKKENQDNEISL